MSGLAHCFHLIMTVIFFPWLFVWVICAVSASNKRKRREDRSREEQIALLKDIASQTRRNK